MAQDRSTEPGSAQRGSVPAGSAQRREVRYSGRVQGVGFRYTTRGIAARLPVTGWVRNLPDGTVQLVVEGTPAVLDELLASIAGELERFIQHIDVAVQQATSEFSSFDISL